MAKTWKQKLNKSERKHLREMKIRTKYDLERQKKHLKEHKFTDPFFCYECYRILKKLGMWEDHSATIPDPSYKKKSANHIQEENAELSSEMLQEIYK